MESNKDEARRAKAMAEARLKLNDILGAVSFARRARTLDPELDDGLSQMLSMLDVYASAVRRVGTEVDWYRVLGVDSSADEEAIKKQYRRLALTLHPDKNSLEGAFKLVSEAKCLLLDRERRSAYDRIAAYQPFEQGVSTEASTQPSGGPSKHPRVPVDEPLEPDSLFKAKDKGPKRDARPGKNTDLFWTICHRCRLHFEYRSIFQNIVIRCARCQNAFTAVDLPRPVSMSQSHVARPWPTRQQRGQRDPRPPCPRTSYPDHEFEAAGNPSGRAAKDDDMLDNGAMDSIFKRRRMDGGVSGNNPNVAEPANAASKRDGSIYACW